MTENKIIHIALENLKNNAGIQGRWENTYHTETNGEVDFIINNRDVKVFVEIKNELRNHQLPMILERANRFHPLMIVANRIFPKIKEELRANKIAYLEANGNIYLNENNNFIWIETQKPTTEIRDKGNRAFTKTGVKVVMQFLIKDDFINQPYREIAAYTEVGLGNINYVINGLKEMGFIINLNNNEYRLTNKKELIEKWVIAYEERLKPNIKIGTFRFLNDNDFGNWRNIYINEEKTVWGGEPAADIITDHLRPEKLTLYTKETRNELMRNYRLVPEENGNVEVYKKFWPENEDRNEFKKIAPWLIVYADLITTDDKRTRETAQMIYERYIEQNL